MKILKLSMIALLSIILLTGCEYYVSDKYIVTKSNGDVRYKVMGTEFPDGRGTRSYIYVAKDIFNKIDKNDKFNDNTKEIMYVNDKPIITGITQPIYTESDDKPEDNTEIYRIIYKDYQHYILNENIQYTEYDDIPKEAKRVNINDLRVRL